jgi:hypothetical protein
MRHKKAKWWLNWALQVYPEDSAAITWLRHLVEHGNGEPMRSPDGQIRNVLEMLHSGEIEVE